MIKHSDDKVTWAWALLALIALVYTAMSALTPFQLDDMLFISGYREFSGGDTPDLGGYMRYVTEMRNLDNSRMSNLIFPAIVLWPGTIWVFNILTGVMMAAIVWMVARIASGSWRPQLRWCVLIWAAMLVALPWRNNIFVTNYTLNYIFSSVIMLGWALLMMRMLDNGLGRWGDVGAIVLGTLAAAWHEGFVAPLLAGLAVVSFMGVPAKTFRRFWAVLVWCGVVMLIFALSPGMLNRAGREIANDAGHATIKVLINTWLVTLSLGMAAVALLLKKGRTFLKSALADRWTTLLAVTAMCGFGLCLIVNPSPRTSFWPELAMLAVWVRQARLRHYSPGKVLIVVLGVFISIQSVLSLYWQHRYHDEHNEIMSLIDEGNITVYYDVLPPDAPSLATLYMPARIEFNDVFGPYAINEYYGRHDIAVVPTAINGDIFDGRRVGDGLYLCRGQLVVDHPIGEWPFIEVAARILTTNGDEHTIICDGTHYIDPSGVTRTWLRPRTGLLHTHAVSPESIVKIEID